MKKIFLFLTVFMAGMPAAYSLTGDDILARVEDTLTAPKDMESRCVMTLGDIDGTGAEKRLLKMYSSGKQKRLIKFMEPAGISGIGLLVESDEEMYLYLPSMNKIRRIEGGSKNEDFQGTDFSYNELSSYEYRKDYSAQIETENTDTYILELKRKPQSIEPYDSIRMTVDKNDFIPSKMELYENGKVKKILTISDVKKDERYAVPVKMRMEDLNLKHYTEILLSDVKFDRNLEGRDVFTKRFLKKKEM